jgi:hypothetical protein
VLEPVEDLAPPRGQRGIGEERAGHRREGIVEELAVVPVQQGDGRRLPALHALREGGVVHHALRTG